MSAGDSKRARGLTASWSVPARAWLIWPTRQAAVVGPDDPKAAGRYVRNIARHRMPAQVLTGTPFLFVYVGDVCEAILRALEKEGNIREKYLVLC